MRLVRKGVHRQPGTQRVAIVGAGPAGLYAAGWLASDGYQVDVLDMLPEPGGLLVAGIPDLRLDKAVVRQAVEQLKEAGVTFRTGTRVGRDVQLSDLVEQYDAVLIATGAWESRRLEVEGEGLDGVFPALEYLVDYALAQHGHARPAREVQGKVVLVVGGGLTAVDACYVARQAGAAHVLWYYRRGREQAPAWQSERDAFEKLAAEVEFCPLTQPVRFLGSDGRLEAVEAVKMRLAGQDASGRPEPVPVEGSEFRRAVDVALVAAGEAPTPPPGAVECGIEVVRRSAAAAEDVVIASSVVVPGSGEVRAEALQCVSVPVRHIVRPKEDAMPRAAIKVDARFRTTRKGVFAAGNVIDGPTQAGFAGVEGIMAGVAIGEYLVSGEWTSRPGEGSYGWRELLYGQGPRR
jgi:glutamate synthase (NADPH/NADH) small chain